MSAATTAITQGESNGGEEEYELRRGPWTLEEDSLLTQYISVHGEGRWNLLARCSGLKRTGKSCRLRWMNYLKPDIKHGNLTPQEQLLILELQSKWGNRWSKIAQHLPGRTDNEIKNYWRTRVQKQAKQLKIESNGKRFFEAVRSIWVPRLIEQMKQSSSSSSLSTTRAHNPNSTCPLPNYLQNPLAESASQKSQNLDFVNQRIEKPSSKVIFSDSMRISQLPEIPGHPTSPACAFAPCNSNSNTSVLLNDSFCVDMNGCGMDGFHLAPTSELGPLELPILDSQVTANEWVGDDMSGTLWNMEELLQFRKIEEMGMERYHIQSLECMD